MIRSLRSRLRIGYGLEKREKDSFLCMRSVKLIKLAERLDPLLKFFCEKFSFQAFKLKAKDLKS